MKFRKLSLLLSFIMVMLTLSVPAFAENTENAVIDPTFVHGNTVVAPADSTQTANGGTGGYYSANKNMYWAGVNVSQSQGSDIAVNIVKKNRLNAFETRVYNTEKGYYSGVAFRVSHDHGGDGGVTQPAYTAQLVKDGVNEFGFEVTYFDSAEMAGNWLLVKMVWQNKVTNGFQTYGMPLVQYEGTNTWRRYHWTYKYSSTRSAWDFYSNATERADFQFLTVAGTVGSTAVNKDDRTVGATYIHDFTMLPLNEFNEYVAKTSDSYLFADKGGVISYGLTSSIGAYNTTDGTVSGSANRFGAVVGANTNVTFSAPNTTLGGKMGNIVVDCYADEETEVTLGGDTQTLAGGAWQKLSFLQGSITNGKYSLSANKNIKIGSIHYEGVTTESKANTITADLNKYTTTNIQKSADGRIILASQTDKNTYMNWYEPTLVSGLAGYKSLERKDDSGNTRENVYSRITFKMDTTYAQSLRTAEQDEVGYEVTYFDAPEMKDKYLAVFMDWAEEGKETVTKQSSIYFIPLTGSGSWKTYRSAWDTYGGWFAPWTTQAGRGNPNFEFWVAEANTGSGRDVTKAPAIIHSLTVMPVGEYMESFAKDGNAFVTAEKGAVISAGMTSTIDGKYQGNGVSLHEGTFGADIAANEALTFTVDNMQTKNTFGMVKAKLYANEAATVTLGTETKQLTGEGWQEVEFSGVSLSGNSLSLTASEAVSVASVKLETALPAIVNKNDLKVRGYNVNVSTKNISNLQAGSKLIVALYNAEGKLIGTDIKEVSENVTSYGMRIDTSETSTSAKIFCLNGLEELKPIALNAELIVK